MRQSTPRRGLPQDALHLWVLCVLAIAQPVWDLLGRNAEFLIAHDAGPVEIVTLLAVLLLAPAAALAGLLALCSLVSTPLKNVLRGVIFTALVAALALPATERLLPLGDVANALASLTCGAIGAALVLYTRGGGLFLYALSPALVICPLFHALGTPVRSLLFAPAPQGSGSMEVSSPRLVLLIVLDELPLTSLLDASHSIDPSAFPNIATLAADSHWYVNATTAALDTTYSVPAILTGRYPDDPRLPVLSDYPMNLLALLAENGHTVIAAETHTGLCPENLCQELQPRPDHLSRLLAILSDISVVYQHYLLPDSFSGHLPDVSSTWRDFRGLRPAAAVPADQAARPAQATQGSSTPAGLTDLLAHNLRSSQGHALFFVHYNLPHLPWKYLPSGQEYGPIGAGLLPFGVVKGRWIDDPWASAQGLQRHLLQLQYADALLGDLLAALRRSGAYRDALVILVADHGASFQPSMPRRRPTPSTLAQIINIPLLVKYPGPPQHVEIHTRASTIDILPTIADVLSFEVPWPVHGRSLLAPATPRESKTYLTNKKGIQGQLTYSIQEVEVSRRDTLQARSARSLPPFASSFYGIRPTAWDVPIDELPLLAPTDTVAVELDQLWQYEHVDPGSGFLPARVTGKLLHPAVHPLLLAVAANGGIEALTQSFPATSGEHRFSAMIRPGSLVEGRNRIEILMLDQHPRGLGLRPLDSQYPDIYRLVHSNGSTTLTFDGRAILLPEERGGGKARTSRHPLSTRIVGRITSRTYARTPIVLLFSDGRFVFATHMGKSGDDAERSPGPWKPRGREARFEIRITDTMLATKLRLIVTDGTHAWDIPVDAEAS